MFSASAQIAGAFSAGSFSRLEAGGTSWERETVARQSLACRVLLCKTRTVSPALFSVFSCFKSTFVASLARFPRSKVLLLLLRRVFVLQKYFRCLPSAVLGFKSTFVASPMRFRASKVLLRFPRRNFDFQKNFYCFPIAILGFKRTFAASPMRFRASKALSRLPRHVFRIQKHFVARRCLAYRVFACSHGSHFCRFAAKNTKTRGLYSG